MFPHRAIDKYEIWTCRQKILCGSQCFKLCLLIFFHRVRPFLKMKLCNCIDCCIVQRYQLVGMLTAGVRIACFLSLLLLSFRCIFWLFSKHYGRVFLVNSSVIPWEDYKSIIKWFGLEQILKVLQFQPFAATLSTRLGYSELHPIHLISNLNLPFFSLRPFSLVLSLCALVKRPFPHKPSSKLFLG